MARPGLSCCGRRILQVPVRIILDNDNVVLAAELVYLFATLDREHTTSGIVAHCHGVDDVGAAPVLGVPILQHILQATRPRSHHSLTVDLDGDNLGALGPGGHGGTAIDENLRQQGGALLDGIAVGQPGLHKHLHSLGEAIGGAAGEYDLGTVQVGHVWMEVIAGELADERPQGRVSVGFAILQSGGEINFLEGISLDMRLGNRDVRRSQLEGT